MPPAMGPSSTWTLAAASAEVDEEALAEAEELPDSASGGNINVRR